MAIFVNENGKEGVTLCLEGHSGNQSGWTHEKSDIFKDFLNSQGIETGSYARQNRGVTHYFLTVKDLSIFNVEDEVSGLTLTHKSKNIIIVTRGHLGSGCSIKHNGVFV